MSEPLNANDGTGADDTGADAGEQWDLCLYVTDRSPKCLRAIENLRRACEENLAGRYRIEIVDLLENPRQSADDQILAVPTVVRRFPAPIRKLVGDLSDRDRLLVGLQLRSSGASRHE
jgi:circadian clock protein KaiB